MGNLQTFHRNIEVELAKVQSQLGEIDDERARYKEAEKKVNVIDDTIADMYIDLQGSIMSELHHRNPAGDYG